MMNFKNVIMIIAFFCILSSCNNKHEKNGQDIVEIDYLQIFTDKNANKPEMIYPIEYYQNEIIENQKLFPQDIEINVIKEVKNIIPGQLCFLVGWRDMNIGRGNIYYDIDWGNNPRGNHFALYEFDSNHNFVNEYMVCGKHFIDSVRNELMEKIPGNKFWYGMISYGDFNNDGINEILSIYLHPPEYEYVFTVFGYNALENDFIPLLFVPVQIHFETNFLGIEYLGNGFRVLEVLEYDPLELAWNDYIWDIKMGKYLKTK
jgi:hypothetical protein